MSRKILNFVAAVFAAAAAFTITAFAEKQPVSVGDTVTLNGMKYMVTGTNLYKSPNFAGEGDANPGEVLDNWYVGTNTTTTWDNKIPNPNTMENLTKITPIIGTRKDGEFSCDNSDDSFNNTESRYYLCEEVTKDSSSYWNGTGSLLNYVKIDPGKSYYFSYYVSAWGNNKKPLASVRYGAINSDDYCSAAAEGKINWSGKGQLNVDQYDGNNMTQYGSWAKKEAVITAGEDADYFFFNLYWLQVVDYACINSFTLVEVEPLTGLYAALGWNDNDKKFTIDFLFNSDAIVGTNYTINVMGYDGQTEGGVKVAQALLEYTETQHGAAFSTDYTNRLYKGVPTIDEAYGTSTAPVSLYSLVTDAILSGGFGKPEDDGTTYKAVSETQIDAVNKVLSSGGIYIAGGALTEDSAKIMAYDAKAGTITLTEDAYNAGLRFTSVKAAVNGAEATEIVSKDGKTIQLSEAGLAAAEAEFFMLEDVELVLVPEVVEESTADEQVEIVLDFEEIL